MSARKRPTVQKKTKSNQNSDQQEPFAVRLRKNKEILKQDSGTKENIRNDENSNEIQIETTQKEEVSVKEVKEKPKILRRNSIFNNSEYKDWLCPPDADHDDTFVYCKWCKSHFKKTNIKGGDGYIETGLHKQEKETFERNNKKPPEEEKADPGGNEDKINKFEISLLELIVKLNLPISLCDPILKFMKLYLLAKINLFIIKYIFLI